MSDKRLPVVNTSVRETKFCEAVIHTSSGPLYLDGNGKITADNGTLAEPKPNAFSLPAASVSGLYNCPHSTETCRSSCYVRSLAAAQPELYAKYESNAWTLNAILASENDSWFDSVVELADWISNNARGGFRWHVSGDVWQGRHARWIVDVCLESPSVQHWIYTRTLHAVEILRRAANLSVNISADRDNVRDALEVAARTGARICYMVTEGDPVPSLPYGSVIFPDYPLRGGTDLGDRWWSLLTTRAKQMVCPVDRLGKSEARRCGPCDRCLRPQDRHQQ